MEKPSNLSTIVQREKTDENIDHIEFLVNKRKGLMIGSGSVSEPSSSFKKSKYGKVIVRELQKGKGIVQIIDNNEDSISIYEIHPNGSYSAKTKNNVVEKTGKDVDAFHIFSGNLQIAIHRNKVEVIKGDHKLCIDGNLTIEVDGAEAIPLEGVLSFSKLKKALEGGLDSYGSPIQYIQTDIKNPTNTTLDESEICYT